MESSNMSEERDQPNASERFQRLSKKLRYQLDKNEIRTLSSLGSGCALISEKKGELTKSKAFQLLEMPEFFVNDHRIDRPLRISRVKYLLSEANQGSFHPEWVIVITAICDEEIRAKENNVYPAGTELRMNGQHCCWMRLEMPENWPCPVHFEKYACKTLADMRKLYCSIDRNAVRTPSDVIGGILLGTEQFNGASKYVLKNLTEGLAFWLWGTRMKEHPAQERAELIQTEYNNIGSIVCKYLMSVKQSDDSRHTVFRSAVISALFETMQKLPDGADKFWDPVRTGVGLTSDLDPRKKLRDTLMSAKIVTIKTKTVSKRIRGSDKKLTSAEEVYRWCIYAWNAWRREETLYYLRAPMDCDRPKAR